MLQFPNVPQHVNPLDSMREILENSGIQEQNAAQRLANARAQMQNQQQQQVMPSSIGAQIAQNQAARQSAPLDVASKRAALATSEFNARNPLLAILSRSGATPVSQTAMAHLLPSLMPPGTLSYSSPSEGGAKSLANVAQAQPVTTAHVGNIATTPADSIAKILAQTSPGYGKMTRVNYGDGGMPQVAPDIGGMTPVAYGTSKVQPAVSSNTAQQLTGQQKLYNDFQNSLDISNKLKQSTIQRNTALTNTQANRSMPALTKLQMQGDLQKLGYNPSQSASIIKKGDNAQIVTNKITPDELKAMASNYYSASNGASSGIPQNFEQLLKSGRGSGPIATPPLNLEQNERYQATLSSEIKNYLPTQINTMRFKANTAANSFNKLSAAIPYLKKYAGTPGSFKKVLDTLSASASGRASPEYKALMQFRNGAPVFINEFSSMLGAGKTDAENKQLQSMMANNNLGTMTPDMVVDNWNQIGDTLRSQQKVLAEKPSETIKNQPKVNVVPSGSAKTNLSSTDPYADIRKKYGLT